MKFLYLIKSKFSISPEDMAKTYIYLATSSDLKKTTGKYFNEKNIIVDSSQYSKNEKNIIVDSSQYSKNVEKIEAVMNITMKYIK